MQYTLRQGDVLFVSVSEVPAGATPIARDAQGRHILATGETSGHAHTVGNKDVQFVEKDGNRYLVARELFEVGHVNIGDNSLTGEHDTVIIEPKPNVAGWLVAYQYEHQRGQLRRVLD